MGKLLEQVIERDRKRFGILTEAERKQATSWTPVVHKTRFTELGFWNVPSSPGEGPSFWQFVDLTGDKPAQVGYQYATKAELLANLEAYATEYGCENASPKPRQDENYARLLRVAKEIANNPAIDLVDSELRIRLYYAIAQLDPAGLKTYPATVNGKHVMVSVPED